MIKCRGMRLLFTSVNLPLKRDRIVFISKSKSNQRFNGRYKLGGKPAFLQSFNWCYVNQIEKRGAPGA